MPLRQAGAGEVARFSGGDQVPSVGPLDLGVSSYDLVRDRADTGNIELEEAPPREYDGKVQQKFLGADPEPVEHAVPLTAPWRQR